MTAMSLNFLPQCDAWMLLPQVTLGALVYAICFIALLFKPNVLPDGAGPPHPLEYVALAFFFPAAVFVNIWTLLYGFECQAKVVPTQLALL